MARPRKLTAAQEQQLGALAAEVGPREASRRAPELVGCEVSPASCLKFRDAGAGSAGPAEAPAPLRPEPAPAVAELAEDADDLAVLLELRRLVHGMAKTAGEKRLLLQCVDRVERTTLQIIKLREQQAPSRKVGILILPPEAT